LPEQYKTTFYILSSIYEKKLNCIKKHTKKRTLPAGFFFPLMSLFYINSVL